MASCTHSSLSFDVSKHAEEAGYHRPAPEQRLGATQPSGRVPTNGKNSRSRGPPSRVGSAIQLPPISTFPAPLVLPKDELSWDPTYPPQSLRLWTQLKVRNAVVDNRRTIYIVPPPDDDDAELSFLHTWATPDVADREKIPQPVPERVSAYLRAFYHGLPVKGLAKPKLRFCQWDQDEVLASKTKKRKAPQGPTPTNIGLSTGSEAICVRARPSPDGFFSGQLNLNDLLDVAIDILPDDAYALLMLVHHDLYEDDDDDFCCGRAYGGSRVAVVSTARYNPALDEAQKVDRTHSWPASHCSRYMNAACCGEKTAKSRKTMLQPHGIIHPLPLMEDARSSAIHAAVAAFSSIALPNSPSELSNLWLGRVCKTASHELGHCFGMDHCIYYACIMQGTAGLSEDVRQPPYLCPVDLAKVLKATGAAERERYQALQRFCAEMGDDGMFKAFGAWLGVRQDQVEGSA